MFELLRFMLPLFYLLHYFARKISEESKSHLEPACFFRKLSTTAVAFIYFPSIASDFLFWNNLSLANTLPGNI